MVVPEHPQVTSRPHSSRCANTTNDRPSSGNWMSQLLWYPETTATSVPTSPFHVRATRKRVTSLRVGSSSDGRKAIACQYGHEEYADRESPPDPERALLELAPSES